MGVSLGVALHFKSAHDVLPCVPCFEIRRPCRAQVGERLRAQGIDEVLGREAQDARHHPEIVLVIAAEAAAAHGQHIREGATP